MSWKEVQQELEKIEQIVGSLETEEAAEAEAEAAKMEEGGKVVIAKDPAQLGARPKVQIIQEKQPHQDPSATSKIASTRSSGR